MNTDLKEYYFDNSATSNPKPETVYSAVEHAIRYLNGNPGRASHHKAIEISQAIYDVRCKLAGLFNISNPLQIAFTANATESLNFAIKGTVHRDAHVITTYFEHNSSLRPLFYLRDEKNVSISFVEKFEDMEILITDETQAIVVNHISNLNGNIQPLKAIGELCRQYNLLFIVDASQSAGFWDIDVEEMNIDILCLTGHKSLFGIQGIGAIYVREGVQISPLLEGGTGSYSKLERQPLVMPELLEAGTLNTPGILSLGAGIDFIQKIGLDKIRAHEISLTKRFLDGVSSIENIILYPTISENRGPVVSINFKGIPSPDLGALLDEEFNILVRSGFHCAPLAHKYLGTGEFGSVRFSFGFFNTPEEIDYAISALKSISKNI